MKEYPVPKEIVLKYIARAEAYKELATLYAGKPFGYKKALKSTIRRRSLSDEFWRKVYDLYPELRGRELRANCAECCVYVNDKK